LFKKHRVEVFKKDISVMICQNSYALYNNMHRGYAFRVIWCTRYSLQAESNSVMLNLIYSVV